MGQNKNNANIHYLLWRVLTGKNKAAQLSFMLVGHTKFAPDRFFGLFKRCFIRNYCSTIVDIERAVRESPTTQQNKAQLVASPDGKEKYVTWYQWSSFLSQYFKPIPNITSFHVFRVSASCPGVVFACEYSDSSEVQYVLLKNPSIQTIDPSEMPETKEAKGLDAKCQWYLYDQIRPLCASTLQADFTCPKPTIPRPTSDTTTLHVPAEIPSVSTQPEATPMGSEKITNLPWQETSKMYYLWGMWA